MPKKPCADCGMETSGLEYYILRDDVWTYIQRKGPAQFLCVQHAEERLGRRLKPRDFADVPANRIFEYSDRLLERMGRTRKVPKEPKTATMESRRELLKTLLHETAAKLAALKLHKAGSIAHEASLH